MTMKERLDQDLRSAMLGHQAVRVSTIRLVKAAMQRAEIDKRGALEDEEVLGIIAREVKQRREAMAEFERGGRHDLVAQAREEMAVLAEYLPEQMGEEEVRALVIRAIQQTGAAGPRDMGKVMGALMPLVKGKADGKLVSRLVTEQLNKA